MQTLKLTPIDSFFFKGHMITEIGSPSHLEGIFPPRPNTVYGALRAAYIQKYSNFIEFKEGKNPEVKKWMGGPNTYGEFVHRALILLKDEQYLLPIPHDYSIYSKKWKDKIGYEAIPQKITELESDNNISSTDTTYTMSSGVEDNSRKTAVNKGKYAQIDHWKNGILRNNTMTNIFSLEEMLDSYLKTGISIGTDTRRAEDSHFYQMDMLNLKEEYAMASLCSQYPDFNDIPFISLGAENRPWSLMPIKKEWRLWSDEEIHILEKQLDDSLIMRVILLTPLIWPDSAGSFRHHAELAINDNIKVKLLSWAIEKADLFGGWDIANSRPKARQWMLPTGAVLYCSIDKSQITEILKLANGFTMFNRNEDCKGQEGFGFAVIAGIEKDSINLKGDL